MAAPRKTYSQQLLDPRWQRKRLEILERDDFQCAHCKSGERTLHVHHTYYRRGAAPWDYPDGALVTLCEDCHSGAHKEREELDQLVGVLIREGLADQARGYLSAMVATVECAYEPKASYMEVFNHPEAVGIAHYFGLEDQVVFDLMKRGDTCFELDFWDLLALVKSPRIARVKRG